MEGESLAFFLFLLPEIVFHLWKAVAFTFGKYFPAGERTISGNCFQINIFFEGSTMKKSLVLAAVIAAAALAGCGKKEEAPVPAASEAASEVVAPAASEAASAASN